MKKKRIILWSILTAAAAVLLAAAVVLTFVGEHYQSLINSFFDLRSFDIVNTEDEGDTDYFKSDYLSADGQFDEIAYREGVSQIARRTAEDGAVLLWNKQNAVRNAPALPIEAGSSVSLFGNSCYHYNYCVDGSGFVKVEGMQDMRMAFQEQGFSVNRQLFSRYQKADRALPWCTTVGELPWNSLFTDEDNLRQYGDNAIFVISRRGCEGTDMSMTGSEGIDGNILDLNPTETEILDRLTAYRRSGLFRNLIVLIASSHAVQFSALSAYDADIDACLWVGMGGTMSNAAIVNLLSGKVNPSGRLTDIYVYNNFSHPSSMNFGNMSYLNAADYPDLLNYDKNSNGYSHKLTYLVYQEGIYVGYRYFETRYEDAVMGNGNASSAAGAKASSAGWNYAEEVRYPFGYGLSYTAFSYSGFNVKENGTQYLVDVTVTNTGGTAGREVVQVYLQKPYTEYDKAHGIEKSAVELAGFAKTGSILPGESETVTVAVEKSALKTYDADGYRTYLLEAGDYYLSIGRNSHAALNNILSAKGFGAKDGMVDESGEPAEGEAGMARLIRIGADDSEKYAHSDVGEKIAITNRFDDVDINRYKDRGTNGTVYLSRSDWQATYPQGASLTLNDAMAEALRWDKSFEEDPDAEMPLYGQANGMSLVMMRGLDYDNEYWDKLLDQLSFEDQARLVTVASGSTQPINSVNCPGTYDIDGPQGLTKFYTTTTYASGMCYPCEVLMGATFDTALIEQVGNCIAEDMLCAGQQVFYGPGANIHRSPFSGRNGEYYSEDGYLTNKMLAAEVRGLMDKGVITLFKHFILNDQETNRHCVNVWCNEQALREIYLEGFRNAVCYEKSTGVMASFNNIGTTWTSAHKGLLSDLLRGEWGFTGYVSTDGADLTWMSHIDGLMAGNDIWMRSGDPNSLNVYKDSPTFCRTLRESAHRIMYAIAQSCAMNGIGTNSRIVPAMNWWQYAIRALDGVFALATAGCAVMLILTLVRKDKKTDE